MNFPSRRVFAASAAVVVLAAMLVTTALASAPPVGPLPKGPITSVSTPKGTLVAVALPHQAGRSWRLARQVNARVLRQVSEADVGANLVVVFKALAPGRATVVFAATRGESTKALAARTYDVSVQ